MESSTERISGFAKFAWFTLAYNILVILWGVFLRASKSGDGCGQHWLTCQGEVIPSAPELKTIIDRARDDGVKRESVTIQRFKGLGEMNPGQLWETALNPDTRKLLKVRIEDKTQTFKLFNMLMSKKESEKRCEWMEEKGNTVEADV